MRRTLRYLAPFACFLILTAPARGFSADTIDGRAGPAPEGAIKIIVIDPGHGGEDTGAIGPRGVKEKDITLAVARELERELTEKTGARILLTRTFDTYLSLEDRSEFANSVSADIFISIHVNAAPRKRASGVETFFLSFDASDDEAREVAAFENNVVRLDGTMDGAPMDDLKAILWDLTQTEAHHESSKLAETIQQALTGVTSGDNRGVKQAPFIVLFGATMPAVLVEIGFISNPAEEKRLANGKTQKTIARAISDGVAEFEKLLIKRVGLLGTDSSPEKN
jgi:N-acetylmuramoyl-L-alanine amidase